MQLQKVYNIQSTGLVFYYQSVWERQVVILFQVLDLEYKLSYGSDIVFIKS